MSSNFNNIRDLHFELIFEKLFNKKGENNFDEFERGLRSELKIRKLNFEVEEPYESHFLNEYWSYKITYGSLQNTVQFQNLGDVVKFDRSLFSHHAILVVKMRMKIIHFDCTI